MEPGRRYSVDGPGGRYSVDGPGGRYSIDGPGGRNMVRKTRSRVRHVICGKRTRRGRPGGRNTPSHGGRDGGFSNTLEILIAHEFVVGWWVVLGEIIGSVSFAGGPIEIELTLCNAIFEPVIAHIKGFGFFHSHLSLQDAGGSGVVSFKRSTSGRLFVTHLFEGSDHGDSFLSIEKDTAGFGFGALEADAATEQSVLQST